MVKPLLSPETDDHPSAAWVVFSDETDIRMLRFLKRGFRHCFVILKQADRWILVDPRADRTDIILLPHPAHFNLPRYFETEGKRVCKASGIITPRRIAPIFPLSCVETVKRVIGLHARFVMTPYRLYRHLNRQPKG